jgi:ABC-2 type transport system ATP-binding protein
MIEVTSLTKRYGARTVVSDISFVCSPGAVTGFLGPNGAGKSTTLKMITALTTATGGTATVLGLPYADHPNPGRRVGVLIDASAQHDGRRGAEVLALTAQLLGVERRRIDEVLSLVGLEGSAARKRVGEYSLGMRQRLGLAHALLGDPEVLILDEPANGLDPEGMRWLRAMLRDFAERGGTVLLSSHLLHEVEATADRLVIIADGQIAAQGTREGLLRDRAATIVRASDPSRLRRALTDAGLGATLADGQAFRVDADPTRVGEVLLRNGIAPLELRADDQGSLEQLFFSLTERQAASSTRTRLNRETR